MKKTYLLPFLALPVLAACGEREASSSSAPPLAPGAADSSPTEEFVDYVRSNLWIYDDVSTATIVQIAETTCESLDNGMSAREFAEVIADQVMTMGNSEAADFGEFVGASVLFVCPEHSDTAQAAAEMLMDWGL